MKAKSIYNLFFLKIPKTISVLFHPLTMPLYGLLILFNTVVPLALMSDKGKQIIILLVLICTLILPLSVFSILYFRNLPNKLLLNERQERIGPLIITSILYYLAFYLLRNMGAPYIVQIFLFSASLSVILTLLVSFFWKISAHAVGIGGICSLVSFLIFLYRIDAMLYLIISILVSGFIGFARLSLNEHTPAQVYAGFFTGLITMFISYIFL